MTDGNNDFFLRFWGTRGSIATPGPETVRYGGNTTCIEIQAGNKLLIIDCGTGLRALGQRLGKQPVERLDLFLTHTHWDHIAGIPFFVPAYLERMEVHFWAGHLCDGRVLHDVLVKQMIDPLFPVPLNVFQRCHYHDYRCGDIIEPASGVVMRTCRLNHPNGACGYRIDYAGKSICIITDTEHPEQGRDPVVVDFVRDADIMIYDAMFTDEEYARYTGWGHSTWEEALRIADAAGVRQAVPFHHDPNHDDRFLDDLQARAEDLRPGTVFAREGQILIP